MILPSLRLPIAFALGATLMAWRACVIAPQYTAVEFEMELWLMLGVALLALGFFWEMLRWYQRMDRRYVSER